jgi:hypothetical protein
LVYDEAGMIKTNFNLNLPAERDHGETEARLREKYPGLRLVKDYYDDISRIWNYDIYFEQEKDYAWFMLNMK